MSEAMEFKCPFCGAKTVFDSGTQRMKCPYCNSELDVDAMKAQDEILKNTKPDKASWNDPESRWSESESEEMGVYHCNSCGGEIIASATLAATQCPYCDSPVVLSGRLSGDIKPDGVIPFKLGKEQAKAALKKHFRGKRLLPKMFSSESRLDSIKGIYVPFWLYDADVKADIHFKAENLTTWKSGDYEYTKTDYYSAERAGDIAFDSVPADGSKQMPDTLMESLEPFDYSEEVDFATAYLSGYLADRYDVGSELCRKRADERINTSVEKAFAGTVSGYTSVTKEQGTVDIDNNRTRYALCPVWIMTSVWKGKTYLFAMNGQTGKFVGDLPMNKTAYWLYRLLFTALFGGALFLLCLLSLL